MSVEFYFKVYFILYFMRFLISRCISCGHSFSCYMRKKKYFTYHVAACISLYFIYLLQHSMKYLRTLMY